MQKEENSLNRSELEEILDSNVDVESLSLRVETLLELEKIKIEREKNALEVERLIRERKRWWANPLIVAIAAGIVALSGDIYLTATQREKEFELQQEKARDNLILKAFSDEVDQTIDNLKFMIKAELLIDPDNKIISAAEEYGPRSSNNQSVSIKPYKARILERPIIARGEIIRITDGDSLSIRSLDLKNQLSALGGVRLNKDDLLNVNLASVDAPEIRYFGCSKDLAKQNINWGLKSRDEVISFFEFETGKNNFVNIAVVGIDERGRASILMSKSSGTTRNFEEIYNNSINKELVRKGLAATYYTNVLPKEISESLILDDINSELNKVGLWSELTREIDLNSVPLAVYHPWVMRRLCLVKRRNINFDDYIKDYLSKYEISERKTGKIIGFNDLIKLNDNNLSIKTPIRDLYFPKFEDK